MALNIRSSPSRDDVGSIVLLSHNSRVLTSTWCGSVRNLHQSFRFINWCVWSLMKPELCGFFLMELVSLLCFVRRAPRIWHIQRGKYHSQRTLVVTYIFDTVTPSFIHLARLEIIRTTSEMQNQYGRPIFRDILEYGMTISTRAKVGICSSEYNTLIYLTGVRFLTPLVTGRVRGLQ